MSYTVSASTTLQSKLPSSVDSNDVHQLNEQFSEIAGKPVSVRIDEQHKQVVVREFMVDNVRGQHE